MITFYHPNRNNKGGLASFKLLHKQNKDGEPHKEGCLWLSLVKQVSWNDQSKTGSFKNGESVNVKFNIIEIGNLIHAIETNSSFDSFHTYKDKVSIKFGPYTPKIEDAQPGFSLQVSRDREGERINFGIFFRMGEIVTLRQLFKLAIDEILMSNYAEEKRKIKEYLKKQNVSGVADDNLKLPNGVESDDDEDMPLF